MMRRTLLKAGLASSFIPLIANRGLAAAFDSRPGSKPSVCISDSRYHASTAFGTAASGLGIVNLANRGDITAIWSRHLDPLWREGRSTVIGMTTTAQLFCLERLAWDRGLKVILQIEHKHDAHKGIVHSISAPLDLAEQIADVVTVGMKWPEGLASILGSCASADLCRPSPLRQTPSKGYLDEDLVSWIIAPAAQLS